jgi:hypothetical protein
MPGIGGPPPMGGGGGGPPPDLGGGWMPGGASQGGAPTGIFKLQDVNVWKLLEKLVSGGEEHNKK